MIEKRSDQEYHPNILGVDKDYESFPNVLNPDPMTGIKTEAEVSKEWDIFFKQIRNKAKKLVEGDPHLFKNNPETIIDKFMEAFRSIFIEITIEDQIKAVIAGVDAAIESAKKKKKKIILIRSVGNSDKLLFSATTIRLKEKCKENHIQYEILEKDNIFEREESDKEDIFLVIDDAAYSGQQKESLKDRILYCEPNEIIFSFGGCSNKAKKRIQDPKDKVVTLISQKDIPDLADQINRMAGEESRVMELAKLMFPLYVNSSGELTSSLIGSYTSFKIPDYTSIPREIRPDFMLSKSIYPNSL